MNVFFLQRRGVNLHHTLLASETSRRVLRFYHPEMHPGGVTLTMASLGSALALAIELRWYIRRYMQDVLFELSEGVYCTLALARQVYYDRLITIDDEWPFRRLYVIRNGYLVSAEKLGAGEQIRDVAKNSENMYRFIVLCSEEEYHAITIIRSGGEEGGQDEEVH
jgi:Family of unknown function (DUF5804)